MAAVLGLHRRWRRRQLGLTVERPLIDRTNPLETQRPEVIRQFYRFRPETILYIVGEVEHALQHETKRSNALPPLLQVLVSLRYFASGSFQSLVGEVLQISQSTTSRAVTNFLAAMMETQHIDFPTGDEADAIKLDFFQMSGFPNVLGCVDGTQISITAPSQNEVEYVNRKGQHAINVQMICDSRCRIRNCVAKWPGSVHDARIFRTSRICVEFENGVHRGLLLGDSGYGLKRYLMTPYRDPQVPRQRRFNISLCRARVLIEQTFGILKRRFSCLGGRLRVSASKACHIVLVCSMLHNIGMEHGDVFEHDLPNTDDQHLMHQAHGNVDQEVDGQHMREHIARQYFEQ